MRTIFAATLVSLMLTTAAVAEDKPAKPPKPPKEKVTCQSHEVVGSHLPHSECHTAAEWEQIAADKKANADAFGDGRSNGNVQPKGGLPGSGGG